MKIKGAYAVLFMAYLGLVSCTATAQEPTGNDAAMNNILIVYVSRTNNTQAVAEIIHDAVGGTLTELELKTPYPENYDAIVAQVQWEN